MKIRRSLVAVASAVALTATVTPAASAQTYPDPLNQVMNELRRVGGDQAPNVLLVPAVLSSIGVVNLAVVSILAIVGATAGAAAIGSS
ncbi:hypothetical protein CPHO_02150 [Corynebacterium phocae]|uniref:Secreted protein n=1 Tax=Corynebacterium phocae TaxID=161895 RepID=A0A1L7D178_9CORY|nr:hypothetical protein [Corynebacterium phocae]APT91906.1 hypothetical protein CPHO_02150 [Corynebacterium phocae]KAA8727364.1 hypothetical protein F4V58_01685 [Corynebacterium phocae]